MTGFRIIASDMDGTLLNDDKTISPENIASIRKAEEAGILFVPATGRPLDGLMNYADALNLRAPGHYAICFNGAAVYETSSLKLISRVILTGSEVRILAKRALDAGLYWQAFSENRGLVYGEDNFATDLEMRINRIGGSRIDPEDIPDSENFFKFMFLGTEEQLDRAEGEFKDLSRAYTMARSMYCFLEVMNRDTSKGAALEQLCRHLGLPLSASVALGDAGNDIHMIDRAGVGVVMQNGISSLKERADYIAPKNTEGGVAHVIEEILSNRLSPLSGYQ